MDSVKDDIKAYLHKDVRGEVRWHYIKGSIRTFTYGAALYYLTTLYPYAKIGFEAVTITPEKLEKIQKESFNESEIKKEMIKDWREAFFELEGHYPDLKNPKEKAEWEAAQKNINNLNDEDLLINFRE